MEKCNEIHKETCEILKKSLYPGIKFKEIVEIVENNVSRYFQENIVMGFPVGINLNEIVAHDSWFGENDKRSFGKNDIISVDFGVACRESGWIVDSAFTFAFDKKYDELIESTVDATTECIKKSGVDVRLAELAEKAEEIIKSYDGLKMVSNLCGHNIRPFKIHGGKIIDGNSKDKMDEDEFFAIETFAFIAKNSKRDYVLANRKIPITHFMINDVRADIALRTTRNVWNILYKARKTMPFSKEWFKNIPKLEIGLKDLINKEIVEVFPALELEKDCYSSQHEQTIYISERTKL